MPDKHTIAQSVNELLKRHGLSVTESRSRILEMFLREPGALSHALIEKKNSAGIDRVTIYRTLQTFTDSGLIHTIPTADNAVLYALCRDACTAGAHHDEHVHFICERCRHTTCLEHTEVPRIELPEGFRAGSVAVVINGTCNACRE